MFYELNAHDLLKSTIYKAFQSIRLSRDHASPCTHTIKVYTLAWTWTNVSKCSNDFLPLPSTAELGNLLHTREYIPSIDIQMFMLWTYANNWLHVNRSVPQGSWLEPLPFVIIINGLQARGLLHKYLNNSTVTEDVSDHLQEELKILYSGQPHENQCKENHGNGHQLKRYLHSSNP